MVAQTGFAPELGYPASGALFLTPLFSKFNSQSGWHHYEMLDLIYFRQK